MKNLIFFKRAKFYQFKVFNFFNLVLLFSGLVSCNFNTNSSSQSGGNSVSNISNQNQTVTNLVLTTEKNSSYIESDLISKFSADGTVYVTFCGTDFASSGATLKVGDSGTEISVNSTSTSASSSEKISDKAFSVEYVTNDSTEENANGIQIQYKGSGKIKYVLSGTMYGTVVIKNKNADAEVLLNGLSITSDGSGPALRFTSANRTFIAVKNGTTNFLTDSRVLDESTVYDDKKGSLYSKGPLIFTSEDSTGGSLTVTNAGYKHGIYSKDYVRIGNVTLTVNCTGSKSRDCIRTLNGVIIDGGTINLTANGTITDDEGCGIKVEGEDTGTDSSGNSTVTYSKGTGFIVINDGIINITSYSKGITAHWKSSESTIGKNTEEDCNTSLLTGSSLVDSSATAPSPFVAINGGTITVTTTGTPYENSTASCSPEGIEAKANLVITGGSIEVNSTDDGLNAGGAINITGGKIYVKSSGNDAIDANGSMGIVIEGGTIVAVGTSTPECAFDCDNNTFKITGGTLVGIGTSNYSTPSSSVCSQNVIVASSSAVTANSTFAIKDSSGNAVFAYAVPQSFEVMVLSCAGLSTGSTYTIYNGVSTGGTNFHGLYLDSITASGGTSGTSFTISSAVTGIGSVSTNGPQEGTRPTGPQH